MIGKQNSISPRGRKSSQTEVHLLVSQRQAQFWSNCSFAVEPGRITSVMGSDEESKYHLLHEGSRTPGCFMQRKPGGAK